MQRKKLEKNITSGSISPQKVYSQKSFQCAWIAQWGFFSNEWFLSYSCNNEIICRLSSSRPSHQQEWILSILKSFTLLSPLLAVPSFYPQSCVSFTPNTLWSSVRFLFSIPAEISEQQLSKIFGTVMRLNMKDKAITHLFTISSRLKWTFRQILQLQQCFGYRQLWSHWGSWGKRPVQGNMWGWAEALTVQPVHCPKSWDCRGSGRWDIHLICGLTLHLRRASVCISNIVKSRELLFCNSYRKSRQMPYRKKQKTKKNPKKQQHQNI